MTVFMFVQAGVSRILDYPGKELFTKTGFMYGPGCPVCWTTPELGVSCVLFNFKM